MRYTASQGFPYPASRREFANAPLASELLARAVDKKLTYLDTEWAAEVRDNTCILTLSTNQTGLSANTESFLLLDTTQKAIGSFSGQQPRPADNVANRGWYHVIMSTEFQAEGAINANTWRKMWVDIWDFDTLGGSLGAGTPDRSYQTMDIQSAGGAVNLQLQFVARLGYDETMIVKFDHNNTSSTLRMNALNTQWTLTRIAGDIT